MNIKKNTILLVSIAAVVALGLGIAIGTNLKGRDSRLLSNVDDVNNMIQPPSDENLLTLSEEELSNKLSAIMLPEDEFQKLEGAIFQTAVGLLMAQAQGAGLSVTPAAEDELKKRIDEKYSRAYFANINAESMKELKKSELITILSFYNTEAGLKFLKLSPKIIEATMTAVQKDLAQWLPKTIEAMIAGLKNKGQGDDAGGEEKDKNSGSKDLPSSDRDQG